MKKLLVFLLVVITAVAFIGCSGQKNSTDKSGTSTKIGETKKPSSPIRYSLGTSSNGGNFYLIGGGIATILNNQLKDYFVITAEETGGSKDAITVSHTHGATLTGTSGSGGSHYHTYQTGYQTNVTIQGSNGNFGGGIGISDVC